MLQQLKYCTLFFASTRYSFIKIDYANPTLPSHSSCTSVTFFCKFIYIRCPIKLPFSLQFEFRPGSCRTLTLRRQAQHTAGIDKQFRGVILLDLIMALFLWQID